jgi:hypothetical protein
MKPDPEAARFPEFISALDSRTDETIRVLDIAAQQAQHWRGRNDIAMELFELLFYLSFIDLESKSFLRMTFTEPSRRFVWEKYLGLLMFEALTSVPTKASELLRHFTTPGAQALDVQKTLHFDPVQFDELRREYGASVRDINKDADFKKALDLIRNNATAHHLDGLSMSGLIDWKLYTRDRAARGISVMASPIIAKAVQFTGAVQVFGQGLTRLVLAP